MKRQDYTDRAIKLEVDLDEEVAKIILDFNPDKNGDEKGIVKIEFDQLYLPCEVCGENVRIDDAVMNKRYGIIREYDKRIGRDPQNNFYADLAVKMYCSTNHAIVGEL